MEEIVFRECYTPGWIGWMLGYLLFSPLAFLVCMNGASFFYGSDGAFFLFYNGAVTFNYWLAYILNITFRDPRPERIANCDILSYGLPDYNLVTVFTFTIVLSAVGLTHRTRFRLTTAVLLLALGALYSVSLWYNEHLTVVQTLLTTSLSCFLSGFWFIIYYTFLIPADGRIKDIRILSAFGVNSAWDLSGDGR
jgi:hypothetical protein